MFSFEYLANFLTEQTHPSKTVVIYPGRFHPFHKGHGSVYKTLVKKYPKADVYVATSAKVELPKSPFSFDQKLVMMKAAGVPSDKIAAVRNPYMAAEIIGQYDLSDTVLIFVVSKKDMLTDPRFTFKPKKDGAPSYLQPLQSLDSVEPANRHGYIDTIDTTTFTVLGNNVTSASQIRQLYANSSIQDRKQIVKDLYGQYNPMIFQIFQNTLGHEQ